MKHQILLCLLVFHMIGSAALADQADDRNSGKVYEGLMISANTKGFNFRINCNGPTKFFSWGSEMDGTGAEYKKTSSCRRINIGLTAGADIGGGCDKYRQGRVFLISFLNMKDDNWFFADRLVMRGKKMKIRAVSDGRWLVGPSRDVGSITSKEGICLQDNGKFLGYTVPRNFRVQR